MDSDKDSLSPTMQKKWLEEKVSAADSNQDTYFSQEKGQLDDEKASAADSVPSNVPEGSECDYNEETAGDLPKVKKRRILSKVEIKAHNRYETKQHV